MTVPIHRWFTDAALTPGRELFRTDRGVWLCEQPTVHGGLLLRSAFHGEPTRLDLLFKGVTEQRLHATYEGLVVRCGAEPGWFELESGEIRDAVRATAFGWDEHELTDYAPDSLAMSVGPNPFQPPWNPHDPDFGAYQPSGPALPLTDLVAALVAGESPAAGAGIRHVHAVVLRLTRTLPDGHQDRKVAPVAVYLTRAEAEQAIRADLAETAAVRDRAAQPGAAIQDVLRARSADAVTTDRWMIPLPIHL